MATKRRIQLRNISNAAASSTAVIECPIGPRYHQINLNHAYTSGTNTIVGAATNIADIRVKVNGRDQRMVSGTHLRAINGMYGSQYDAYTGEQPNKDGTNLPQGVTFPIFFAEPWRKQPALQELTAWATNWKGGQFDTFQVHVTFGAATSPLLTATAVVDDVVPDAQTNICKWLRHSVGASGTAFDWQIPDRRDYLQQISIFAPTIASSGYLSKVEFRKDGVLLHELTHQENAALLAQWGMTPQPTTAGATNRYDLVLDHDDLLGSAVNMNGSRDATLNIQASNTMSATATVFIMRLGPPE